MVSLKTKFEGVPLIGGLTTQPMLRWFRTLPNCSHRSSHTYLHYHVTPPTESRNQSRRWNTCLYTAV